MLAVRYYCDIAFAREYMLESKIGIVSLLGIKQRNCHSLHGMVRKSNSQR